MQKSQKLSTKYRDQNHLFTTIKKAILWNLVHVNKYHEFLTIGVVNTVNNKYYQLSEHKYLQR